MHVTDQPLFPSSQLPSMMSSQSQGMCIAIICNGHEVCLLLRDYDLRCIYAAINVFENMEKYLAVKHYIGRPKSWVLIHFSRPQTIYMKCLQGLHTCGKPLGTYSWIPIHLELDTWILKDLHRNPESPIESLS